MMDFDVEWDPAHRVARVSHTRLVLDSPAVVQAWRERLFHELDAIRTRQGARFPIVVCIDNFVIRPKVADAYGRVVREMIERYATGVARYGEPSTVKQIIAVEAMKEGFRANLFETLEQAVAYFGQDPSTAPPTSRSLRSFAESSSTPPASRGLRSPGTGAAEPLTLRSVPPRPSFKGMPSPTAARSANDEPSAPLSRRSERIIIR